MSHKPFHIPLRTSSINPRSAGNDTNNQRDSRARSIPKAQRILGTTDIALDSDYHQRPDKRTSRSAGYLSANDKPRNQDGKDDHLQPPSLRVLASSPELGQESRGTPQPTPPLLSLSRKLHLTGSSSGLYSRHTSKEPAVESKAKPTKELDSALDTGNTSEGGLNPAFKQPKGPMKETKRKTRPPRIDLSLLFPKPQPTATRTNDAPLLSPQRMTSSPSAISFASEITTENPLLKTHKSESRLAGKKLTKTPPRQRALSRPETTQQALDGVLNSTIYETPSPVWSNPSLEKTVRTNEMDLALQKNFDTLQTPRSTERAIYSQMNFSMRGRDHTQRSDSKSLLSARSGHSAHSSQRTLREAASLRGDSNKGASMSKKSSKSTLKNSDLNTSSVLCLSSSEDEDDTTQDFKPQFKSGKTKRDSVSTYGGYEAEICTAAAAQATRGTLRSVERPSSSNTQHSRSSSKYLHPQRGPANPLANKSSNGNRRSRRSSGVPAILEPDFLHSDPMFDQTRAATRKPSLSQKEINRRSRLMAVTRQEERLLEVMRTRDGKITPSIFNENFEPDRRSMASALSVPSRDSYYGSDTSFLRLSPSIPPASARTSQATSYKVSGTSTPKGTGSDSEGKTSNPVPSPQASLSSKSLPSPTASTTSPITPTLPIHRFSPLPSQKPPPHLPPPPVPDLHRNHSRRRTDSSGAIAIDDAAPDQRESGEFPVWALGWTSEGGNMTASPLFTGKTRLSTMGESVQRRLSGSGPGAAWKHGSWILLTVQYTTFVLLVHYSRMMPPTGGKRYLTSTAVFFSEVVKLTISLTLALYEVSKSAPPSVPATSLLSTLAAAVFSGDSWKLAIPAGLYTLSNSLTYIALSNLQASTFQTSYQLKIVVTSVFGFIILGRGVPLRKWGLILLLIAGVALPGQNLHKRSATYEGIEEDILTATPPMDRYVGILATLGACATSGISAVYFEKVMRDSARSTSLWIRNVQIAVYSVFPALFIGVIFLDGEKIANGGVFDGYNWTVWACILVQAFGGIIAPFFAGPVFADSRNHLLFEFEPTLTYIIGTFAVLVATYLCELPSSEAKRQGLRPPPIHVAHFEKESKSDQPSPADSPREISIKLPATPFLDAGASTSRPTSPGVTRTGASRSASGGYF
ncbi:nucleotide-sugar transporter-domain-containing protein [Aspergillus undulatus]|uniref:nucleotide-sugar transporter-domain-containing protein n=1 Tax=Aspergillus undulatus TaxID=1810928 RepID=UPI003CCD2430